MKEHRHIKRNHKSELTTFTSYSLKKKNYLIHKKTIKTLIQKKLQNIKFETYNEKNKKYLDSCLVLYLLVQEKKIIKAQTNLWLLSSSWTKNRYRDGIKDIIYTFLIYSYGFIFISFNNVLGLNFLLVNFLLYFFKLIKMGLSLLRVKNKNLWGVR
jgi:hypothetical protein